MIQRGPNPMNALTVNVPDHSPDFTIWNATVKAYIVMAH